MVPGFSNLSSLECESCHLGKQPRKSFPRRVNNRATSPFDLVHTDVWGPYRVTSTLGFRYFVIFVDDFSRYTWLFLMKERFELFHIFQTFCAEIQTQFGHSIKILRSDNAKEFFGASFNQFMTSRGMLHQSSCVHTPQQNGVAERKNRHLVDTARTLLLHSHTPPQYWADAVLTACHLINRMPSSVLNNEIPYSILFPARDLFPLPPHVFGCVCFVHDTTPGLAKMAARSIKCIFLGYSRLQKGYRCYSPLLKKHFISADVTFIESSFYYPLSSVNTPSCLDFTSYLRPIHQEPPINPPSDEHPNCPPMSDRPLQVYHRRPRPPPIEPIMATPVDSPMTDPASPPSPTPALDTTQDNLPIALRKGTRSTLNPHPIYNFLSYHRLSTPYYAFISHLSHICIPKTTHEALTHPEWRKAMLAEMEALHSSGTWDLVPLPTGKSVVGCRWIYTVKVGPDGEIDRFKARLVAKGYTQIYGLDYTDTFSPVAKIASVRLVLSMAAMSRWPLFQLDIKNAFLHGDLHEEVYMEQPPGFVAQGESGMVCRLRRSLYGLKQSPRAWFGRFSAVVCSFGMIRSDVDHSIFYRHSAGNKCIYLVVYVDDIVITGSDDQGIALLKQHLFSKFQTKDLGKLRYFLGIEVAQSQDGIALSQRKYALDILEETGLLDCRPVDTPMDPNVKLVSEQGDLLPNKEKYRRLIGKLNYLTITRPDISFAVSVLSQFLDKPCTGHWDAAIRVLRYIKKTPGQGLLFEDRGHRDIVGYCDADWAGCLMDRRSTSGYCILIGGNLISWKSKKQDVVARSSAEAEYRAMALVTCEILWLKHLLQELKYGNTKPAQLMCDNQAAMHIASNPVYHERTKHIEVDCHFIREKITSGHIITKYVNTTGQLADILTKSLRGPRVEYICNKLGTYDLYAPA
ncbi:unnamed protein product [Cuscuta epithymum]|uniref:Integrase catalytic domain-containing protein n=1 Tax=Cuscuta epithymum TaxID=186058 RepID=A0AAV0E9A5_9ASTE|nr:unnamed protein product [Cuscuta epithymum]